MTLRLLAPALTVLAALLLLPGLLIGPSLDAAVFAQVATGLRDGDALYIDAWDHKPPGMYLLLLAGQLALPFLDAWQVSWVVSALATGGVGIAVTVVCHRLGVSGIAAALAAVVVVVAMAQYLLSLGGGLTEPLATLPVAIALAIALGPMRTADRSAATGALLGVALLVSLQLAGGALAVALLAVLRVEDATNRPRALAYMVAGGALPIVAAVAWLAATGTLVAAVDAVVGYSAAYRAVDAPGDGQAFRSLVAWTVLSLVFLLLPAVLGASRMLRAASVQRKAAIAALAWIGVSLLLFGYQGRFYAHYAVPLTVPLGLLAAAALDRAVSRPGRPRVAAWAPLALGAAVSLAAGFASGRMEADAIDAVNAHSRAVGAAVHRETAATDEILVWGNAPQAYLAADRGPATAYSYLYPLVTPGYSTPAMIDSVLDDLAADPPAVVVDAGSRSPGEPGFHRLLKPRPLATDGRDLDILDPLRQYIDQNYLEEAQVGGWILYRLRPDRRDVGLVRPAHVPAFEVLP